MLSVSDRSRSIDSYVFECSSGGKEVIIASNDGMGSILGGRYPRHVMSLLVCGLDVHKHSTILDPDGRIINQVRMNNENVSFVSVRLQC